MIGDQRVEGAPPCDALAEGLVLLHLLLHPDQIGTVDLKGLLVFREHRDLWDALRRTYAAGPYATDPFENTARFQIAFNADLERVHGERYERYMDLVYRASETEAHRADEDASERPHHEPGFLAFSEYFHGFDWWLRRLQRIAEARRGIQAAQEIAEGFYRVPERDYTTEDAHAVLRRRIPVHDDSIGMEVPV